jgi:hypothetical protein
VQERVAAGGTAARRRSPAAGFWLLAAAFLVAMAFTTVPTPLYGLYQARDHFGPIVTTVVFAAYAVGVAGSLLLVGHLSDHYGRRPLVLIALLVEAASAVVFLASAEVPALIVARLLSGIAVGGLTAAATAGLGELRGRGGAALATAVATAANIGGLGLGPLAAGAIATAAPAPLATPYGVFLVLLLLAAGAVLLVPETVRPPVPRPPYRPQRLAVPPEGRQDFAAAGAAGFAAFAVFGLFTSVAPTFLAQRFGVHALLAVGAVPCGVFLAAATSQIALARLGARSRLALAVGAVVAGLGALAAGGLAALLALFVAGGLVAGAGVGLLFRAALGTAAALAPAGKEGEVLAGLFLLAYLGLIVPVLAVGAALAVAPPTAVLTVFAAAVAVLVLLAGGRLLRRA